MRRAKWDFGVGFPRGDMGGVEVGIESVVCAVIFTVHTGVVWSPTRTGFLTRAVC